MGSRVAHLWDLGETAGVEVEVPQGGEAGEVEGEEGGHARGSAGQLAEGIPQIQIALYIQRGQGRQVPQAGWQVPESAEVQIQHLQASQSLMLPDHQSCRNMSSPPGWRASFTALLRALIVREDEIVHVHAGAEAGLLQKSRLSTCKQIQALSSLTIVSLNSLGSIGSLLAGPLAQIHISCCHCDCSWSGAEHNVGDGPKNEVLQGTKTSLQEIVTAI